jgi:hypothetical protein
MPNHDFQQRQLFPRLMQISSAHLSGRTARFLQKSDAADFPCLGGHWGPHGWIMWVDAVFDARPSCPPDLREVFEFAEKQEALIVLFDECGPIIPELKIYREDVADSALDEYAERERKPDEKLEDEVGEAALDALATNRRFQEFPDYFVAAMSRITNSLSKHCERKTVAVFSFKRLQTLSSLSCAISLCARREPRQYAGASAAIAQLRLTIDGVAANGSMARRGFERKIVDTLDDILFRFDAAGLSGNVISDGWPR